VAYTNAFSPTTPADNDPVSSGDDEIRKVKAALIERLETFFLDINEDPLAIRPEVLAAIEAGGETVVLQGLRAEAPNPAESLFYWATDEQRLLVKEGTIYREQTASGTSGSSTVIESATFGWMVLQGAGALLVQAQVLSDYDLNRIPIRYTMSVAVAPNNIETQFQYHKSIQGKAFIGSGISVDLLGLFSIAASPIPVLGKTNWFAQLSLLNASGVDEIVQVRIEIEFRLP
jgi:hypothetical protein